MSLQTRDGQSVHGAGVILYPTDLVTRAANFKVAAVDASDAEIRQADYLCTGTGDNVVITAAITALPTTGGKIILSTGGFVFAAAIALAKDKVTIEGQGLNTLLSFNATDPVITTNARTGVVIQGLGTDAGGLSDTGATESVFKYWKAGIWQETAVATEPVVCKVWLVLATPTQALTTLPATAQVLTVDVWVQEAFNAGTTNLLTVGYTADPDAYVTSLDVTAAGVKTPAAGATTKTADATSRAAVVYYTQTGAAATTGKALVTMTYVITPAIP